MGTLSSHFHITWLSAPSGQAFEAYVVSVSHPVSGRKPCRQVVKDVGRLDIGTTHAEYYRG